MMVVKIGGPAYRIGMGGGAASSRASGDADAELDFNAVQRGDAEMENKVKYVVLLLLHPSMSALAHFDVVSAPPFLLCPTAVSSVLV